MVSVFSAQPVWKLFPPERIRQQFTFCNFLSQTVQDELALTDFPSVDCLTKKTLGSAFLLKSLFLPGHYYASAHLGYLYKWLFILIWERNVSAPKSSKLTINVSQSQVSRKCAFMDHRGSSCDGQCDRIEGCLDGW